MLNKLQKEAKRLLSVKTHQKWVINITRHFEERFLLREELPRLTDSLSEQAQRYLALDEEEKLAKAVAYAAKTVEPGARDRKVLFTFKDGKKVVDEITVVIDKMGTNAVTLITWYRPGKEYIC